MAKLFFGKGFSILRMVAKLCHVVVAILLWTPTFSSTRAADLFAEFQSACLKPKVPSNAEPVATCTQFLRIGSSCTFTCKHGYKENEHGVYTVECMANRTWDQTATGCVSEYCYFTRLYIIMPICNTGARMYALLIACTHTLMQNYA